MSETRLMLAQEQIIAECLEQMRQVQRQMWLLQAYAEHQVACEDGFRGLFEVLRPALGELAAAADLTARRFSSGYGEVIETLDAAARSLRTCDEFVDAEFGRLACRLDIS